MNTIHLQYMLEIERTGSISHAADNMYMNQSTLSKIVKELEKSVGINIFQRTSKGVIPTKLGREFLVYSREIINQEAYIAKLADEQKNTVNSLSVSVPRASYIAYAFTKYYEKYGKNVMCNFCETNSIQAINNILDGGYSFGIIRYNESYEVYFHDYLKKNNLEGNVIWDFNYYVIMNKKHPLASDNDISDLMLEDYCEIIHGDMQVPYLMSNTGQIRGDNVLYIYERGSQFDILSSADTVYMKVSPVPEVILGRTGLVIRRYVSESNNMRDVLVYKKGYKFSDIEELFIREVFMTRDAMKELLEN